MCPNGAKIVCNTDAHCNTEEWTGFGSWTRRHMWVESVVGSWPCSEGFSLASFPPSTKINTSKFQFDLESVDEEPLRGNGTVNSLLLL